MKPANVRYKLYEVMLYTQTGQVAMQLLLDMDDSRMKALGTLHEQYLSAMTQKDGWKVIRFFDASGAEGVFNPNAISFIGSKDVTVDEARRMLGIDPPEGTKA